MSHITQLYLITPPWIEDLDTFALRLAATLDAAPVAALQIRLKGISDYAIVETARKLIPVAHHFDTAVILNDHPKLAKSTKCDGVHIGQEDMSLREARDILGTDAMIGVTCHNSRHLAMEAAEGGADYVAFGAFFPTKTKDTVYRAEPELLGIWQESMTVPCVAIGGITAETAGEIAAAGADFIAVSSSVWDYPQGSVAGLKALWAAITA